VTLETRFHNIWPFLFAELELGQTQIRRDLCVAIDLGNVGQEVEDTAGVTPLVVV
jgi:hypothetical protein